MRNMSRRMFAAVTAGAVLGTLGLTGASAPQAAGAPHAARAPAAPGTQLWVSRYNGPGHDEDDAAAVATSPDGQTVFATGDSWLDNPQDRTAPGEYVTIAYRAATGAVSVAVSPAGLVFVTGTSQRDNFNGDGDYATIAYRG